MPMRKSPCLYYCLLNQKEQQDTFYYLQEIIALEQDWWLLSYHLVSLWLYMCSTLQAIDVKIPCPEKSLCQRSHHLCYISFRVAGFERPVPYMISVLLLRLQWQCNSFEDLGWLCSMVFLPLSWTKAGFDLLPWKFDDFWRVLLHQDLSEQL